MVDRCELLGESTRDVRTGINATAVYLETEQAKIVLSFTGRHHAGEIIDQMLAHRAQGAKKLVKVTPTARCGSRCLSPSTSGSG
jgi:hypothetical protein